MSRIQKHHNFRHRNRTKMASEKQVQILTHGGKLPCIKDQISKQVSNLGVGTFVLFTSRVQHVCYDAHHTSW